MTFDTESLKAQTRVVADPHLAWRHIGPVLALLDVVLIAVAAVVIGILYYLVKFETTIGVVPHLEFGLAVGIVFLMVRALRGDYAFQSFVTRVPDLGRLTLAWLLTFLTLLSLFFLLKIGDQFSRGTALMLFVVGPILLALQQAGLSRLVMSGVRSGWLAARRVYLVGGRDDISRFRRSRAEQMSGLSIVGASTIDEQDTGAELDEKLRHAVAAARRREPDDVLILVPLADEARIDAIVSQFKLLPTSIHLGIETLARRYPALRSNRDGDLASLELVREPLTNAERYAKRVVDIAGAMAGLILLSPILLAVAVAIKLTSRGPVFYRQDRHCYNQSTFRIFKFRSMYDTKDSAIFRQARKGDSRITPVGAFIRRTNLDELPQLINVLIGDMSLVGPRPHPIALDQEFEHRIAYYGRRHNVKPGITGWAQVNGFRGETDTEDKMRGRIEHDLHYLEHWSLLLDFKIMLLTLSSKAFKNAG